ncbi:MAG: hypothetical protein WKF46_08085 [Candidatus Limnocylindrales bacterium]
MTRLLDRLGLARLIRLGVLGAIPPAWFEIAVLHLRGSFQSRPMWTPLVALPIVALGGAITGFDRDEARSRARFRPLSGLLLLVGAIGTLFHVRGVGRQMGGFTNWRFNMETGPPFPAPAQLALFGAVGVLASGRPSTWPHSDREEDRRLVAGIRAANVAAYGLLAMEAGWEHRKGEFHNRAMFTPVTLGPALMAVHTAAAAGVRPARAVEGPLSALAVGAGLVGFGFHVRNVLRRRGGLSLQNLFYGPPTVAPLSLTGQGLLGVLAALFDRRR